MDLFDYKPHLARVHGQEVPDSVFNGQRLTGMTSGQPSFPVASSAFGFRRHGQGGIWMSDAFEHLPKVADQMCVIRSLFTEAINHDPAITFLQSGFALAGVPASEPGTSYGLGSENKDLPAFVAMLSGAGGQPLYDRLWGAASFLPSIRGCAFAPADPRPSISTIPPGSRVPCAGRPSTTWPASTGSGGTGIQSSRRASPSTRWPTACRCRCRAGRHVHRASACDRPVRRGRPEARNLRLQRPAGAQAQREGSPLRPVFHRGWDTPPQSPGPALGPLPRDRPGHRRPDPGSQAERLLDGP